MKKKTLFLALTVAITGLCISGCSSPIPTALPKTHTEPEEEPSVETEEDDEALTLEAYYDLEENASDLYDMEEQILSQYEEYYSDISVFALENTLYLDYFYKSDVEVDVDALASNDFTKLIASTKDEVKAATGITPDDVVFSYLDSEGNILYSTESYDNDFDFSDDDLLDEDTLEAFYSTPEKQAELEAARDETLKEYSDYYSDIQFYFVDNSAYYDYYYQDGLTVDADELRKENFAEKIEQTMDGIENESGIRPDTVAFSYYDSDSNLIYSTLEDY